MARYKIIHSSMIPGGGYKPVNLGYPIDMHMVNDICLCCYGKTDFIPLNSAILKEALVSDPEGMAKLLGIKVIDLAATNQNVGPKQEKPLAKPKPKKQKKEPVVEDLGEITEDDL